MAEKPHFTVKVKVRGLTGWGVYSGPHTRETADRVARRLRARGWYGAVRVIDDNEWLKSLSFYIASGKRK